MPPVLGSLSFLPSKARSALLRSSRALASSPASSAAIARSWRLWYWSGITSASLAFRRSASATSWSIAVASISAFLIAASTSACAASFDASASCSVLWIRAVDASRRKVSPALIRFSCESDQPPSILAAASSVSTHFLASACSALAIASWANASFATEFSSSATASALRRAASAVASARLASF